MKRTKQQQSEIPSPALSQRHATISSPRRSHVHQTTFIHQGPPIPAPQLPPPPQDDNQFFDRVKRALESRDTYNEFLKLVNLFTQDIIDTARLVKDSRKFLGDTELLAQFKEILGFDERRERFAGTEDVWTRPMGVLDRPNRDRLHERYGSYRKLPANVSRLVGMCDSYWLSP